MTLHKTKKILRREQAIPPALGANGDHPLLQQIYANRGITHPSELTHQLQDLLPYHPLLNIDRAVLRLTEALTKQERILVVGDYDVDGATATALTLRVLRACGALHVDFLAPDRFVYGYGLTPEIVLFAKESYSPHLIITVDNGIASIAGVRTANEQGIDVIVTDHHLADKELPEAFTIINPNQPGDAFPSKHLSGVGVIFYVLMALRAHLRAQGFFETRPEPNLAAYLDLVALGTIADMVSLDRNNRILAYQGILRIRQGKCCAGIKALLLVARREISSVTTSDLGFAVGPRLNAAGRLQEIALGIRCLLTDDDSEASKMAAELEKLNLSRRTIEQEMHREASVWLRDYHLENQELPFGVCLKNDSWHHGVVGVIASRIKDQLHRPVIAFAPYEKQFLKGSARSVAKLHIRNVLSDIAMRYPGVLVQFGGHAMAAGLMIHADRFDDFTKYFNREVTDRLTEDDLCCEYVTDGALTYEYLDLSLARKLQEAGPWGADFPEPVFDGRFQIVDQWLINGKHLKLVLEFEGRQIDAIMFNANNEAWPNEHCQFVEAVYRLQANEYRGRTTLQLMIEHLEPV